jgi:hypothetical protein
MEGWRVGRALRAIEKRRTVSRRGDWRGGRFDKALSQIEAVLGSASPGRELSAWVGTQ